MVFDRDPFVEEDEEGEDFNEPQQRRSRGPTV